MSHFSHPLYSENEGYFRTQSVLPLPPSAGFPHPLRLEIEDEPRFDPSIHLELSKPDYVVTFPNIEKRKKAPPVTSNKPSQFAWSGPFQLLSAEGLSVVRSIVSREKHRAVASARGSKQALRGLYYSSPFLRDLQNCPQLLSMFEDFVGEPLLPHFCFSNSPQVNFSTPGSLTPVDHWHNDSIAYAGVVVISDMDGMEGGDLELFRGSKELGKKLLKEEKLEKAMVEKVSYENPGKMILTHGSEVLHHVTPVTSDHTRVTLIFGLSPANAFQPPLTILSSMIRVDWATGVAPYEFYREKAWQTSNALAHFAEVTPFTKDGSKLASKLRSVATELIRAADLLDGTTEDTITFFDENKNKEEMDYEREEP